MGDFLAQNVSCCPFELGRVSKRAGGLAKRNSKAPLTDRRNLPDPFPSRQFRDRQSWRHKMSEMQLDLELALQARARLLMQYRKKVMECEEMLDVSSLN